MEYNLDWYKSIHISRREQEVLQLVCEGKTDTFISVQLEIAYETVKDYGKALREKFNAHGRAELSAKATALGFVDTEKLWTCDSYQLPLKNEVDL